MISTIPRMGKLSRSWNLPFSIIIVRWIICPSVRIRRSLLWPLGYLLLCSRRHWQYEGEWIANAITHVLISYTVLYFPNHYPRNVLYCGPIASPSQSISCFRDHLCCSAIRGHCLRQFMDALCLARHEEAQSMYLGACSLLLRFRLLMSITLGIFMP